MLSILLRKRVRRDCDARLLYGLLIALVFGTPIAAQEQARPASIYDVLPAAANADRNAERHAARALIEELSREPQLRQTADHSERSPLQSGAPAGIVAARIDLAFRLLTSGAELKQRGHPDLVSAAAAGALGHLAAAEAKLELPKHAPIQVQIIEVRGAVHEWLNDDIATARMHYEAAKLRGDAPMADARLKKLNERVGVEKTPAREPSAPAP